MFSQLSTAVGKVDWPTFATQKVLYLHCVHDGWVQQDAKRMISCVSALQTMVSIRDMIRILRLTEKRLSKSNAEFANADDHDQTMLITASILQQYKLHVAVTGT